MNKLVQRDKKNRKVVKQFEIERFILGQFSFHMTHCIKNLKPKNLKTFLYIYFYNVQIKSNS